MEKLIASERYRFRGALAFPVAASPDGQPWRKKITSTSGNATVAATGGAAKLTLSADNEVQNLCLYWGDDLTYLLSRLVSARFLVKVPSAVGANTTISWGLASARNDTPGSIATRALFRLNASNALKLDTDDGTNESASIDAGVTVGTGMFECVIDLASGIVSTVPATGGLGDTRFLVDKNSMLQRVGGGTRFNLSAASGSVQPFFQVQKTASTDTGSLEIVEFAPIYRDN